jgi:formylglycine-generating enzyme required for sulfatase activity
MRRRTYYDEYPRSAFRNYGPPGGRFNNGGFRTVLAPGSF